MNIISKRLRKNILSMQVLQIAMFFFAWFLVFEFIIYFVTSLCLSF